MQFLIGSENYTSKVVHNRRSEILQLNTKACTFGEPLWWKQSKLIYYVTRPVSHSWVPSNGTTINATVQGFVCVTSSQKRSALEILPLLFQAGIHRRLHALDGHLCSMCPLFAVFGLCSALSGAFDQALSMDSWYSITSTGRNIPGLWWWQNSVKRLSVPVRTRFSFQQKASTPANRARASTKHGGICSLGQISEYRCRSLRGLIKPLSSFRTAALLHGWRWPIIYTVW